MPVVSNLPDLLEIDTLSPNGQGLLTALSHRHGPLIAAATKELDRLFLLRAPWAPGLRFAGGSVTPALEPRRSPIGAPSSFSGSGETIEDALASCVGEAVERLSQVERPGDVVAASSLDQVVDRVPQSVQMRIEALVGNDPRWRSLAIDWVAAICARTGRPVLLPADWCLRRDVDGPIKIPGAALSTGAAAGPSFEHAAARAILELVERDAASLWWIGGRQAPFPSSCSPVAAESAAFLQTLRQGDRHRSTWLLDVTSDLRIPVIAALSTGPDGYGLCCGIAARCSPEDAARSAILEMCQMELALNMAEARAAHDPAALSTDDTTLLRRASDLHSRSCALLHGAGASFPPDVAEARSASTSHSALVDVLAARNIDIFLVDMTRDAYALPVVFAVAPHLQLMPGTLETDRLRRTITATGGGARYTRHHSLA